MPRKQAEAPSVNLIHPNGRTRVTVRPERAEALRSRGYSLADPAPRLVAVAAPGPSAPRRDQLIARARELGIPAKGTSVVLAEAIARAETEAAAAGED